MPFPAADPAATAALASASYQGRPQFATPQTFAPSASSSSFAARPDSPRTSVSDGRAPFATDHDEPFTATAVTAHSAALDAAVLSDNGFPVVRKKIVRTVEVPVTRTVKVPIQLLPDAATGAKKAFHVVNETYTDYVERPAVRHREVWVKRVVPEQFTQKVAVTRTRQVKVPVAEGSGYRVVAPQDADAWRIDTVQDTKLVEVEEWADFELRPVPVSRPVAVATRELHPAERAPITAANPRTVLRIVRDADAAAHDAIREVDASAAVAASVYEDVPPVRGARGAVSSSSSSAAAAAAKKKAAGVRTLSGAGAAITGSGPSSTITAGATARRAFAAPSAAELAAQRRANAAVAGLGLTGSQTAQSAAAFAATGGAAFGATQTHRLGENAGVAAAWGIRTAAVGGAGVRVVGIPQGSTPAIAGLQLRDVVTHVNARPTNAPEAFTAALDASDGPVSFNVVRGAIKMKVVVALTNSKNKGY
jgi:hypothetical protein